MRTKEIISRLKDLQRFNLDVNCTEMINTKRVSKNGNYVDSKDIDELIEIIELSESLNGPAIIDTSFYKKHLELEIKRLEEIGDYDTAVEMKQRLLEWEQIK